MGQLYFVLGGKHWGEETGVYCIILLYELNYIGTFFNRRTYLNYVLFLFRLTFKPKKIESNCQSLIYQH